MIEDPRPVVGLRRTHRKSRTGCKTCRGRHIRCDEKTPICWNCERSGRQCFYVTKTKEEGRSEGPPVDVIYSFPGIAATRLPPQEIFLLQHITTFCPEVHFVNNKYSTWLHKIPALIGSHRFLLDVTLGFSAAHHNLTQMEPDSAQLALYYRGRGLKGLQDALDDFSESNADAVLASSLILTWYTSDWKEWSSLSHGIRAIQSTMKPYAERSAFLTLIEEQDIIPEELLPAPPTATESDKPGIHDVTALNELLERLQDLKHYLADRHYDEEESFLERIISFAVMLQGKVPMISTHEQFESSRMLWLALVTVLANILRMRREPKTIIVAAYFYATALVVAPLFPAMGIMFFGHMALAPLTQLGRHMEDGSCDPISSAKHNWEETAGFMSYAMECGRRFRAMLGWPTGPKPVGFSMPYSTPISVNGEPVT